MTLMTSLFVVALDDVYDDAVGFIGIAGPVDFASGCGAGGFELFEVGIEIAEYLLFDLLGGVAERFPVGHFADDYGALVADGVRGAADVAAELGVAEQFLGGLREMRRRVRTRLHGCS